MDLIDNAILMGYLVVVFAWIYVIIRLTLLILRPEGLEEN